MVRLRIVVALVAALAVTGCETFDKLFSEKETPLPGDRKPLFPQGVPGVTYGEPPPQPANAPQPQAAQSAEQPPPAEDKPPQKPAQRRRATTQQ